MNFRMTVNLIGVLTTSATIVYRVYIKIGGKQFHDFRLPSFPRQRESSKPLTRLDTRFRGYDEFTELAKALSSTIRSARILERFSGRLVLSTDGSLREGDRMVAQGTYQVRLSKPLPTAQGGLPVQ